MPIPTFSGFGLGLRKPHYADFLETDVPVDFVEVISENFMVAGGRPRHILRKVRERRLPLDVAAVRCHEVIKKTLVFALFHDQQKGVRTHALTEC